MNITNERVIEIARKLEFDIVGFSKATNLTEEISHLKTWLSNGYHHNMSYMERNLSKRENISEILTYARSIISLGINYYKDEEFTEREGTGKVSRYAWGKDYHFVLWDKLKIFSEEIKKLESEAELISYVDTGPVMDKVWAVKAGLGWMGKHTNVISKEIGSWFFIATVITNLEFEQSIPKTDLCGTCTACIDACPTNALDEYLLDARRCISNLTIENKGEIPEEFKGKFENWIFGCDICQEVCPWNRKYSKQALLPEFLENTNKELDFSEIHNLTNNIFKKRFEGSPIQRAGLKGMKRNANFLQENYTTKNRK